MNLRYVLEVVTKTPIDVLLEKDFTGPLGMTNSYYNRGNKYMHNGIAPTEYQIEVLGPTEPQRPQPVWGQVKQKKFLARTVRINASRRYTTRMRGVWTAYQVMLESFLRRTISRYFVR